MRKTLLMLGSALALYMPASFGQAQRPDRCGIEAYHKAMIAEDPSWAEKFKAQIASLQGIADDYIKQQASGALERTTDVISPVPVIFHIIVDSSQFNTLGGTAGIIKRCDSQIAVLNRDFNHENADSTHIPSLWKPYYGNVGIHFGLARVDPSGNCSPGYEIKIVTASGYSDENSAFRTEKSAATGLAAWDVTKYYNVWCINFNGSANGLLGITQPKSDGSTSPYQGVVILYNTLGSQTTGAGTFLSPYNLGRTLTHETGHFFEIWHPWGDDQGQCPTWSSDSVIGSTTCVIGVGQDDGLADTPPESDNVYGAPGYTISGGTFYDCCKMHGSTNTQPIGIACLSYMDYTDDDAMHLFTPMQAAVMASMALVPPGSSGTTAGEGTVGENYTLTQHPSLLVACSTTGVAPTPVEIKSSLSVYPNPTSGEINISINSSTETLNNIAVYNLVGQQVATINGQQGKDYYSIDLSGMSKGIYFVRCNFASGSVTRKIMLQ